MRLCFPQFGMNKINWFISRNENCVTDYNIILFDCSGSMRKSKINLLLCSRIFCNTFLKHLLNDILHFSFLKNRIQNGKGQISNKNMNFNQNSQYESRTQQYIRIWFEICRWQNNWTHTKHLHFRNIQKRNNNNNQTTRKPIGS